VPLHLGIAVCLGMVTFGLIMLVGNLAFVSPALVRSCIDRLLQRRSPQVTVENLPPRRTLRPARSVTQ
jgi:hypothetical protein